jgi:hypothetical protein
MEGHTFRFVMICLFAGLLVSYALYLRHAINEGMKKAARAGARRMRGAVADYVQRYAETTPPGDREVYSKLASRLAELPLDSEAPTWRRK